MPLNLSHHFMKFFFSYFLFLSTSLVIAQNYGSLNGRIIDVQTQQPLVGATILLEDTSYGVVTRKIKPGVFALLAAPFFSWFAIFFSKIRIPLWEKRTPIHLVCS